MGIFKQSNKCRVVSRYQRRDCATSLNVQEYVGEKKIYMGENFQPKHCPNQ